MSGTEREILNTFRYLLDIADSQDFLSASNGKGVSGYLKTALEALALERLRRRGGSRRSSREVPRRGVVRRPRVEEQEAGSLFHARSNTDVDQIRDIILHSKRFARKAAITDFAAHFGLRVLIKAKDSRTRAAQKLANALISSPEAVKARALSTLFEMSDDQTRGWFDVIQRG